MFFKNKIFKIILVLIIIGLLGYILYFDRSNGLDMDNLVSDDIVSSDDNSLEIDSKKDDVIHVISVDIKGAVKKPGVYQIESDKKVIDVVNLADGLADNADTSLVNLAKNLSDEMVIIIYTKDQVKEAKKNDTISTKIDNSCVCPKIINDACLNGESSNSNSNSNSGNSKDISNISNNSVSSSNKENSLDNKKVNINNASLEELQSISGIGESKAKAIIEYRDKNGSFKVIDDILNVSGIGQSLFEKIKEYITV